MEEIKIIECEPRQRYGKTVINCIATAQDGRDVGCVYVMATVREAFQGSDEQFAALAPDDVKACEDVAISWTAQRRRIAHLALRMEIAKLNGTLVPSVVVSFNPCTCDPTGEGEELAKAITDAADNDSGAIGAMLQAAECLGAEILDMDVDPETLATKIFENDTWRERLKTAIASAETWIAEVDSSKPTE